MFKRGETVVVVAGAVVDDEFVPEDGEGEAVEVLLHPAVAAMARATKLAVAKRRWADVVGVAAFIRDLSSGALWWGSVMDVRSVYTEVMTKRSTGFAVRAFRDVLIRPDDDPTVRGEAERGGPPLLCVADVGADAEVDFTRTRGTTNRHVTIQRHEVER